MHVNGRCRHFRHKLSAYPAKQRVGAMSFSMHSARMVRYVRHEYLKSGSCRSYSFTHFYQVHMLPLHYFMVLQVAPTAHEHASAVLRRVGVSHRVHSVRCFHVVGHAFPSQGWPTLLVLLSSCCLVLLRLRFGVSVAGNHLSLLHVESIDMHSPSLLAALAASKNVAGRVSWGLGCARSFLHLDLCLSTVWCVAHSVGRFDVSIVQLRTPTDSCWYYWCLAHSTATFTFFIVQKNLISHFLVVIIVTEHFLVLNFF